MQRLRPRAAQGPDALHPAHLGRLLRRPHLGARWSLLAAALLALCGCEDTVFPAGWYDLSADSGLVTLPPRDGGADLAQADLRPPPDLRPAPDLAGTCPGSPCDLVCQNCRGGEKCTLDGSNALACLPTGSALPGQACTFKNGDTCAAGSVCLTAGQSGIGACFRYCRTSADCPGGGFCSISVQGTSARVCTDAVTGCAILPESSGCTSGTACYPVNDAGQLGCHVAGSGGLAAACLDSYDCQAGFACFTTPAGCQKLCRRGVAAECPNGQTCTDVKGWTSAYGVCL